MAQYINKDTLVAELNRLIAELVEEGEDTMFEQGRISAFEDVKVFINHTLEVKEAQEEPVSNTILLYGLSGSVGIEEAVKETKEYKEWQGDPERQQSFIDFAKFGANYKHHTSKDLEEAARSYSINLNNTYGRMSEQTKKAFKAGAQWQKQRTDKAMTEALRTEYEKGRADTIAEIGKKFDDCRRRQDIMGFLESIRLKEE